jgi:hypothetical protein
VASCAADAMRIGRRMFGCVCHAVSVLGNSQTIFWYCLQWRTLNARFSENFSSDTNFEMGRHISRDINTLIPEIIFYLIFSFFFKKENVLK